MILGHNQKMVKALSFMNCALGLSLPKIWHDTFRLFLNVYGPDSSRELLGTYLSTNATGILVGGIMAGSLTDTLTPKITFPISTLLIGILSTILIMMYEIPVFDLYVGRFFLVALLLLILSALFTLGYSFVRKVKPQQALKKIISAKNFITYALLILLVPILYYLSTYIPPIYNIISAKQVIIFIRGFWIAVGMNSAYVAVSNLYKNDKFLATASNYLYMILFGALAATPILIEYLPKKPTFIVLTGLMYLVSIILWFYTPVTEMGKVDLRKYFDSCRKLAFKPEFLAVCCISMVCIGGFYNLLYIFTDAGLNNHFGGNISVMQSIGRQCTFGILALIYFGNISFLKTSDKNCSQYMSFGMLVIGISCLAIFGFHLQIPQNNLGLAAQIAFWITCLCTGFCQPACKYAVLSIAQKTGRNMSGAAQSFVTLSNSIIEQQGAKIILGTPYPFGSRIYIICLAIFSLLLSAYLYWQRNLVNSYLKVEKD
jgi:MFS family permease